MFYKVIAACASGIGTSQMIKMKIQKVFAKLDIKAEITHCSIGDAKMIAKNYDIIYCSANFADRFADAERKGVAVIGLKNLMDEASIEAETRKYVLEKEKSPLN